MGPNYYNDQRETVLGETAGTRVSQRITASFVSRQQWGTLNMSLDWLNCLHDFDRHALTFTTNADLRLGRGFSLNINGAAARIPNHDEHRSALHVRLDLQHDRESARQLAGLKWRPLRVLLLVSAG